MEKLIILQGLSLDGLMKKIDLIVEQRLQQILHKLEPPQRTRYLSRKEASTILKITLPTLHDWAKAGLVKSHKIGSRVLFNEQELEEAIEGSRMLRHKRKRY